MATTAPMRIPIDIVKSLSGRTEPTDNPPVTQDVVPSDTASRLQDIITRAQAEQQANAPTAYKRYDDGNGGNVVTVYTRDGSVLPREKFKDAIEKYDKTGKAPKGFVVLPEGIQNTIRAGLAKIGDVGRSIAAATPSPSEVPPDLAAALQMNPDYRFALGMNRGVVPAATQQLSTPENVGNVAGAAATATATGGAGIIPSALAVGAGSALGGQLAGMLTGGSWDTTRAIWDTVVGGISQGTYGVFKNLVGRYLSKGQVDTTLKKVLSEVQGQYPEFANHPDLMNAQFSIPEKISAATQGAVQSLRGNMDNAIRGVVADVNKTLPRSISQSSARPISALAQKLINAENDVLNNINNPQAVEAAKQASNDAFAQMMAIVKQDFKGKLTDAQIEKVADVFRLRGLALDHYHEGAQVMNAFADSLENGVFSLPKFMGNVANIYKGQPGSLLDRLGTIAGEGRFLPSIAGPTPAPQSNIPLEQQALARGMWNLMRIKAPWLSAIPRGLAKVNAGAPVGRAGAVVTPLGIAGESAIRSFIGESQ